MTPCVNDMSTILAVEGGGTKTTAWLVVEAPAMPDGDGEQTDTPVARVLATAAAGPSNYHTVGTDGLETVLASLIQGTLDEARVARVDVGCLALGLAGVQTPADRVVVRAAVSKLRWSGPVALGSDAQAALLGATRGRGGTILIAGTGSIAYGMAPDGREARCGGWGHEIGDEGSGYSLGRRLLGVVARMIDGRERKGPLLERLTVHLGLRDEQELTAWIRGNVGRPDRVASLAQLVLTAAGEGSREASELLAEAAGELVRMARTVAKSLDLTGGADVVLYGGLLTTSGPFSAMVTRALELALPLTRVMTATVDAGLCGCVWLARRGRSEGGPA
ncbi:MAG: hypothetical protein HY815_20605 [Candidatus Riflebacteria bacterium]|nr:hypothetical protein [Candidatus Riflebacteria bacterium]